MDLSPREPACGRRLHSIWLLAAGLASAFPLNACPAPNPAAVTAAADDSGEEGRAEVDAARVPGSDVASELGEAFEVGPVAADTDDAAAIGLIDVQDVHAPPEGGVLDDLALTADVGSDGPYPESESCPPNEVYPSTLFAGSGRQRRVDALPYPGLLPRGVTVWLPVDYGLDDETRFPVVFVHDGQNVFDPQQAAFGVAWEFDETVDELTQAGTIEPHIVVAIDNTPERLADYTPTVDPSYGGGQGDAYADFVALGLKPLIDASFRTRCGAKDTTLIGSSLGGLITLHVGYRHGDRFGKLGAVSPSLWWNGEEPLATYGSWSAASLPLRLWIDAGGAEGKDPDTPGPSGMVSRARQLRDAFLANGMSFPETLGYLEEARAGHHELAWQKRLPFVLAYLLGAKSELGGSEGTAYVDTFGAYTSPTEPATALLQWRHGAVRLSPPAADVTWTAAPGVSVDVNGQVTFDSEQLTTISGTYAGAQGTRSIGAVTGQDGIMLVVRVATPATTPPGATPRLVGSLAETGQWEPTSGIDAEPVDASTWEVRVVVGASEPLAYKWTLGSWDTVEKGEGGVELTNRVIPVYQSPLTVVSDVVVGWAASP